MNDQKNERMVLTVPEAAALLGLSTRNTYTLCRRADFPVVHLTPNRIGVSRVGLERWVADQVDKGGSGLSKCSS